MQELFGVGMEFWICLGFFLLCWWETDINLQVRRVLIASMTNTWVNQLKIGLFR